MYMNGETVGEQRTMAAIQAIAGNITEVELRDLFAMNALNGLMIVNQRVEGSWSAEAFSKKAYEYADAMLVARRKK